MKCNHHAEFLNVKLGST